MFRIFRSWGCRDIDNDNSGGKFMWKFMNSLGVMRERSAEMQSITNRATSFCVHYDHAMLVAAELEEMIAASKRDLNDAYTRLRAAVPASTPSHLITEDNVLTEE